jgi:hypothetical protein
MGQRRPRLRRDPSGWRHGWRPSGIISVQWLGGRLSPQKAANPKPILGEESEFENFFGQLWRVPRPNLARVRHRFPNLQCIMRDLGDLKILEAQKADRGQEFGLLCSELESGGGAQGLWKQGECRSFLHVLTGEMAGR